MQFQLKAQALSSVIYLSSMKVDLGEYGSVIHGSAPIDAAFIHKLVLPPLTCIASGFKHGATCSASLQATLHLGSLSLDLTLAGGIQFLLRAA